MIFGRELLIGVGMISFSAMTTDDRPRSSSSLSPMKLHVADGADSSQGGPQREGAAHLPKSVFLSKGDVRREMSWPVLLRLE